jgi:glycine/serine hydroxymethyltransferase
MKEVARIIGEVLRSSADEDVAERARGAVRDLMDRFPAYPG